MKTRIISALVALPLLIIFIVLGNMPLKIAITVLTCIGLYELYRAFSGFIKPVHYIGFAGSSVSTASIFFIVSLSKNSISVILFRYRFPFKSYLLLNNLFFDIILILGFFTEGRAEIKL